MRSSCPRELSQSHSRDRAARSRSRRDASAARSRARLVVRHELALAMTVQVQHADPASLRRSAPPNSTMLHEVQRHADDVPNAECDRAHVHVREVAVEEVRDDLGLTGSETPPPAPSDWSRTRCPSASAWRDPRASRISSSFAGVYEHDERALRVRRCESRHRGRGRARPSSTRPYPSALNPLSSMVIARRSTRTPLVNRSDAYRSSSADPERHIQRRRHAQSGRRHPDFSSHSVTGSPLTNVP